jgi:hypothetical protein
MACVQEGDTKDPGENLVEQPGMPRESSSALWNWVAGFSGVGGPTWVSSWSRECGDREGAGETEAEVLARCGLLFQVDVKFYSA